MSFSRMLDGERVDECTFKLVVRDGWQQGRGAWGGLLIGSMVRAAIVAVDDVARVVRSVTAELLGPVLTGDATLKVEKLRQGAGVSAVRVRLMQSNEELCCAVVVFGKDRGPGVPSWNVLPPPLMPDWRSVDVASMAMPMAPSFSQHFHFRVTGPYPFSGGAEPVTEGFIQPVEAAADVDAAVVVALADCYWPAAFATFAAPRPAATITFALEICCDLSLISGAVPWFHSARAGVGHGGYCVEHRQLWSVDGTLIAQNQQLFALIK
jgi:acyl-CoA thioesterase